MDADLDLGCVLDEVGSIDDASGLMGQWLVLVNVTGYDGRRVRVVW